MVIAGPSESAGRGGSGADCESTSITAILMEVKILGTKSRPRGQECPRHTSSDAHWHYDVAVLVVFAFFGAELAGGLGVFEFEADLVGAGGF